MNFLEQAGQHLQAALQMLRALECPPEVHRAKAIVVTNVETGLLWLQEAHRIEAALEQAAQQVHPAASSDKDATTILVTGPKYGRVNVYATDERDVTALLRRGGAKILKRYANEHTADITLHIEHECLDPVKPGDQPPRYTATNDERGNIVFQQVSK